MSIRHMVGRLLAVPAPLLLLLAATPWPGLGQTRGKAAPVFQTSHRCLACHNGVTTQTGEDISIGFAWRATMMANSSRDPYWQAGVRRETIDHPTARAHIEDECSKCHMPMARFNSKLAGHEGQIFAHLPFDPNSPASLMAADGVSCSVCHQITSEKFGTRESFVGGFVIDPAPRPSGRPAYGPFEVDAGRTRVMRSSSGFQPTQSAHIRQSEMCATCHTLITTALDPQGKVIGELPEQVPYQEWWHSAYRQTQSCQSCHMPALKTPAPITSVLGQAREEVSQHTFLGGNFFLLRLLNRFRNELSVESPPQELELAAFKTLEHLQTEAARVAIENVEVRAGKLEAEISITNLGGHKLPTAYPSRRVWLHLSVRDRNQRTIFESGGHTPQGAIQGNDNDADPKRFEPHYTVIEDPGQVQIYEDIMVDQNGAVTTGLLRGLRYLKDNRILPRGFDKRTAGSDIAVAGAALQDQDFTGGGDRVRYSVTLGGAPGPFQIEAALCYQSIGYRWAENLRQYDTAESRRFLRYYDSMSPGSVAVLARASASK